MLKTRRRTLSADPEDGAGVSASSRAVRPIDQQVIVVTGSTDGLGRALARELAARGATVLLHGRDARSGDATAREIREATGNERLAFYLTDFSSLAEVRGLAEQILAEHERLDVLVNNAGIGTRGRTAPSASSARTATSSASPSCTWRRTC